MIRNKNYKYGGSGGGDDKKKPAPAPASSNRLNYQQIQEWNTFMENNPNGDLPVLYNNYRKLNPKTNISYDALQNELNMLNLKMKQASVNEGTVMGDNVHTGNRFPHTKYDGTDLGPMNGDGNTQVGVPSGKGIPNWMIKHTVPDDITKLEWNHEAGQPYYLDGEDIVYVDRKFYNNGRFVAPTNVRQEAAQLTASRRMGGNIRYRQLGGDIPSLQSQPNNNWMQDSQTSPVRPVLANENLFKIDQNEQSKGTPNNIDVITPSAKVNDPWAAYHIMRSGSLLASEIAGGVERARQNQYFYNQQSTLGQMNPMPTEDFQPNAYNLYSKYGGNLKMYTKNGKKC